MTKRRWRLIDVDADVWTESLDVGPDDVDGSASGYSVAKRTLAGGLRQGVDLVEVDNGVCRFSIIPTRGMGIRQAWLGELPIGWNSPVKGPVHPCFVPVSDPNGLGWLDGFDELIVRCGLESNGAPEFHPDGRLRYPLHGRIANRPAHKLWLDVDGDSGQIDVTGVVDESRFHFQKLRLTSTVSTRVDEKGFRLRDTVSNLSGDRAEMQILYHINIGQPLLGAGARLVLPAKTIVPRDARAVAGVASWDRYAEGKAGFEEQVYYMELLAGLDGDTRVLLVDPSGDLAVSIAYDPKVLPCFSQWKNTPMPADGYVTGLEPATNFPNPRSFEGEQERVVSLAAGESVTFEIAFEVLTDHASVTEAREAIERIEAGAAPQVHDQPLAGWCPG